MICKIYRHAFTQELFSLPRGGRRCRRSATPELWPASQEKRFFHRLSHRGRRCEYSTIFELNIQPVPNFIKGYAQRVIQNNSPAHAVQPTSVAVEDDHEFRDFIESITVTKEELAAIVSSPGYSIPEIKQCLWSKPGAKEPPVGAANRSPNADAAPAKNNDRLRLLVLWARLMQMTAPTSIKKPVN